MRILVTGSRDWDEPQAIAEALIEARYEYPSDVPQRITLVSGACLSGADAYAEAYARMWGWHIEQHPADWVRFGKRAGFLRNKEMVDLGATVCLAFIKNGSRGATMTARLAEDAGIPVKRFEVTWP